MKKRIFTFLTLLVAFFGLIGLTTNNYKVINAAGDQASVDFDASVAINSVPDTAILSFPVTYESVYGNDIAWTVVANDYITYDETAQWMVVKRSTTTDGTAKIIVTVSNGTYEKTEEKTVTIPKGFTSAPIYNIEYDLKDGAFEEGVQVPTSYKLGDASFNLPIPTKTSFVFKGWLDAEGNEVKTILVGSMKSYSLTAQWEAKSIKEIKVTKDPTKIEYKGGETIDLTGIEVTAYYNDETTEPISSEQLICKEYVNYGEIKVELKYQGFTTSFNVTVKKNSWNITFSDKTVTYDGTKHSVTITEELPTAVNVSYENNTLTNVGNVEAKVSFSWNTEDEKYDFYSTNYELPTCEPATLKIEKAILNLTPIAKEVKLSEVNNIEWEFTADKFLGNDTIAVVTIVPTYYDSEGNEVNSFIAGKTYEVAFTGEAENYTVSISDSTLKVESETVTFKVEETYTYNGEEQILVVKAFDVNNEEISGVLYDGKTEYKQTNAGDYVVKVSLSDPSYGDVAQNITITIKKLDATITVSETTSIYGDEVELAYTTTILEQDQSKFTITLSGAEKGDSVGSYPITIAYEAAEEVLANYNISKVEDNKHIITKRDATITVSETTSIYGDEVELAYTTTILEQDQSKFTITLSGAEKGDSVGSYSITIAYEDEEKVLANYNITEVKDNKHIITQKPLKNADVTITVDEGDYNAQNENTLKPGVTIKYGEIEITTYEELEYAYADGYVGSATITITLTGNYSGTLTAQFEVTEYGKAGVDAALLPNTITEETTELPLTIGSSKVLWGTSNSAFSVDENGIVTVIHPTGDDVKVTLTAEVTYGTTSFYAREYQIVVSGLHRQQSNNVIVDNAEDVTLSVTVGENANYVVTPTEDNTYNTIAAYDISFTNESGEVSTFANPVTVRIPLPNDYNDSLTYAIWHKVGETYESVEYTVESGYFVFTATSFSPYIVTIVKNNYTIEFNANEGEGEMNSLPVVEGTSTSLPDNEFERTGYTFTGWNTQADGQGTSYADKASISVTGNITLYAQWEENATEGEETTVTVSIQNYATANNWENSKKYTTINMDDNIAVTAKGGTNTGKYYTNGYDWRIYQTEAATVTVQAKEGIVIVSVKITYNVSNTGVLTHNNNNITSEAVVKVNANSVEFSVGNTDTAANGQVRITAIEVVYSGGSSSEGETPTTYTVTFNPDNGETAMVETVEQNASLTEPEEPKKGGFTFSGWFNGNTEWNFESDKVTSDLTLTAQWKEISTGDEENPKPSEIVTATLIVANAATANEWINGTKYLTHEIDENISMEITGGANSGTLYDDNHLRIYATDNPAGSVTITAKEGYKIKTVSFGLVTGTYAFLQLDGVTVENGQTVEIGAASAVFNTAKNGSNGKQVRILSVTVTYEAE